MWLVVALYVIDVMWSQKYWKRAVRYEILTAIVRTYVPRYMCTLVHLMLLPEQDILY